ncbi:hypothetical protein ACFHYQ_26650 [Sphaerimonospora cavernae]|uniref:XRE family transcriptional regulator n=1 Tax=Sphaerimonospora cavernae TaxID=1740611 RepID=A0ABV6UCG1_9ACTN
MEDPPIWAVRLKRERRPLGWSQKGLARKPAEVAGQIDVRIPERASLIRSIKNWEVGKHHPRDPYPMLLSRALGIGEEALFGEAVEVHTPKDGDDLRTLESAARATEAGPKHHGILETGLRFHAPLRGALVGDGTALIPAQRTRERLLTWGKVVPTSTTDRK